jgi:hypothetical protein
MAEYYENLYPHYPMEEPIEAGAGLYSSFGYRFSELDLNKPTYITSEVFSSSKYIISRNTDFKDVDEIIKPIYDFITKSDHGYKHKIDPRIRSSYYTNVQLYGYDLVWLSLDVSKTVILHELLLSTDQAAKKISSIINTNKYLLLFLVSINKTGEGNVLKFKDTESGIQTVEIDYDKLDRIYQKELFDNSELIGYNSKDIGLPGFVYSIFNTDIYGNVSSYADTLANYPTASTDILRILMLLLISFNVYNLNKDSINTLIKSEMIIDYINKNYKLYIYHEFLDSDNIVATYYGRVIGYDTSKIDNVDKCIMTVSGYLVNNENGTAKIKNKVLKQYDISNSGNNNTSNIYLIIKSPLYPSTIEQCLI